ncbi:hypothetical protein B0H13DRAFT_2366580 [Mycena leptocephala]|nr:hypothetical protein B0H13DRAFT_2366580 [Mycena leptocephala]
MAAHASLYPASSGPPERSMLGCAHAQPATACHWGIDSGTQLLRFKRIRPGYSLVYAGAPSAALTHVFGSSSQTRKASGTRSSSASGVPTLIFSYPDAMGALAVLLPELISVAGAAGAGGAEDDGGGGGGGGPMTGRVASPAARFVLCKALICLGGIARYREQYKVPPNAGVKEATGPRSIWVWRTLNSEYTVFTQGAAGDGMPKVVARYGQLPEDDMTTLKRLKIEIQFHAFPLGEIWFVSFVGGIATCALVAPLAHPGSTLHARESATQGCRHAAVMRADATYEPYFTPIRPFFCLPVVAQDVWTNSSFFLFCLLSYLLAHARMRGAVMSASLPSHMRSVCGTNTGMVHGVALLLQFIPVEDFFATDYGFPPSFDTVVPCIANKIRFPSSSSFIRANNTR